jgi:Prenyltransferase and squalene oxidase repeat
MEIIDVDKVNLAIENALELLGNSFHASPLGGGGWYHQLELPEPGPTATALAVATFLSCDRKPEHFNESLEFLRIRQVTSSDSLLDGGWSVNTSIGYPVVEATGWVTWMLAKARCAYLVPTAPDVGRGYRWLTQNQNQDGGWGSFAGAPSRVWLTCIAMLGIAQASPYDAALDRAIEWLMAQRDDRAGGWGAMLHAPCTTTHTAMALYTITGIRPGWSDRRVMAAYTFLTEHLDTVHVDDQHARVESYNVQANGPHGPQTWSANLLHYGLPWAVSALLRHPVEPPGDSISAGIDTILRTQMQSGSWPNIQGAVGSSIWALWPFIEALAGLKRLVSLVPAADVMMGNGVVIIQSKSQTRQSTLALLRSQRRVSVTRFLARYWSAILVTASVFTGLVFVWLGQIGIRDYLLGLIVPVGIFAIQQIREQGQRGRE